MNLVSMKYSKEESKEVLGSETDSIEKPEYPYGLQISLDDDSLEKLGFNDVPIVGQEYTIIAKVKVVSANSYESTDSDKEFSSSWQITDMAISTSNNDSLKSLYPSSK